MKRAAAEPDPSTYHRLRIVGKRFRYALEFLSDVYPGETSRLVRRTVAFQDLLGDYQDAIVATARLRALSSEHAEELGPETVFAMGEMSARSRWAMDGLDRRVASTYAKLDGKAWKRLRKHINAAAPLQAPARVPPSP
jgi:CHAD domain-containing protein